MDLLMDWLACLNHHDKYDDDTDDSPNSELKEGGNTGGYLDDSCTTMAGYFDMGVSAFTAAGWLLYVWGILYVFCRPRGQARKQPC